MTNLLLQEPASAKFATKRLEAPADQVRRLGQVRFVLPAGRADQSLIGPVMPNEATPTPKLKPTGGWSKRWSAKLSQQFFQPRHQARRLV